MAHTESRPGLEGCVPTHDLPAPVRTEGRYVLRHAPWQTIGYSLWMDFHDDQTMDDPAESWSILVTDDLPASAVDDFDTYVDEAEEEVRCMMAEFRDFG